MNTGPPYIYAPLADQLYIFYISEVEHLTDDTFETFLASEQSILIMFYAPW